MENNSSFRVGSLGDHQDVNEGVKTIKNGGVVAAQMRRVFGMWVRGDDAEAVKKAHTLKGEEDLDKKMGSMMFCEDFVPMIHLDMVPKKLQPLVKDASQFKNRIGAMFHVRAPIKPEFVDEVPVVMKSYQDGLHYVQNLDPHGHWPTSSFIWAMNQAGIKYVAVTSLNDHAAGETEIHKLERAIEFCKSKKIPLLLADPIATRKGLRGSFAIIDLSKSSAVRDGHISIDLVEKMLGVDLDRSEMKPANYPPPDYRPILELDISPEGIRAAVIVFISGEYLPS
jgi:tRNA A37 threonylcarbamoyladenosine synthetase subunit TsaC/SUA5/YrdC